MTLRPHLLSLAAALTAGCLGTGRLEGERCPPSAAALIEQSCLPCHSATLAGESRGGATYGVDFDSQGETQRHAQIIREQALDASLMPPNRALSDCERRLLDAYLTELEAAPCIVSCSARLCGGDNCGGSCGSCGAGLVCDPAGQCIPGSCEPSCQGVQCGPDGCGGSCGQCEPSLVCSGAGACVCQPSCAGRACGGDGCGGSCGSCPVGSTCTQSGLCVCIPDCAGKECGSDGCGSICAPDSCSAPTPTCDTDRGQCVASCSGNCLGRECGDDGCGLPCGALGGACPAGESCIDNSCVCVPSCAGKQCGADGCGGSCGACAAGLDCVLGQCGCTGSCTGRECGDDGCGVACGPVGGACPASEACSLDGLCVCAPACAGRSCGDDGCGGSCGTCSSGSICQDGVCSWPQTSYAEVHAIFQAAGCGSSGGGQSCHGGARPAANLDLSTQAAAYPDLVNVPADQCNGPIRVVPGDPALSYLIAKLTGSGICFGTVMPKAGATLPASQIDVVRAWIGSGAAP